MAKGRRVREKKEAGFTLVELLVVIAIIAILSSVLLPAYIQAKKAAYFTRARAELRNVATAVQMYAYANANGQFPADANRDLPNGIEQYLAPGNWPKAPWPGSVYDWDNWAPGDLSFAPNTQVYQVSIRFCPIGEPTNCSFPDEVWAQDFDYYSAVYYCISGSCRAHSSQPVNHPGYCVNC